MSDFCILMKRIFKHFVTVKNWGTPLTADLFAVYGAIALAVYFGITVSTDISVTSFHGLIASIVFHAFVNTFKLEKCYSLRIVTGGILATLLLFAFNSVDTQPYGSDLGLEVFFGGFLAILSVMINFWVIHQLTYSHTPFAKPVKVD